jgi:HD-GYP domain-containing protein (c-di-GMP phosphodiesterase class II)
LQLINRKKEWGTKLEIESFEENVVAFDTRCEDLASSLASQAAVSIENVRLYEEIQKLFEGFIVASVHAIEQRDPTTSGHSERVAELTVGLAQIIDRLDTGSYKNVKFSKDDIKQIKYAGLLHDFGKIGVREHVLVKAKKLYPNQLDIVKWRFKFIKKSLEVDYSKKQLEKLLEINREQLAQNMSIKDPDFEKQLKEVDDFLQFVLEANEPRILAHDGQDKLSHIADLAYRENGSTKPYLEKDEIHLLSIPRGSLSQEERVEIESHVTHTFNFLNRIPWASHLKSVPEIAYAHHEKLDGSGYPRQLNSPEIPIPSKMMTIADIYDALTASDRPYKRAVPSERALEILGYEMKDGKIDSELFSIFVESKVFEITMND